MDIRKTLLWAIFTISALLLFNAWQEQTGQGSLFSKSTAPAKQQAVATDNGTKDLPKPSGTALAAPTQTSAPKSGELLTLKNDVLELEVDTLGGVVSKARLLKHLEEDKSPVLLFDRSNDRQYFARTGLVSGSGAELPNHTQVFTATKNQA
ncbi:MAG: membrane protein insertase YidC, partial [Polynucleobacter victoriensis]